jgi:hypothetical protein
MVIPFGALAPGVTLAISAINPPVATIGSTKERGLYSSSEIGV